MEALGLTLMSTIVIVGFYFFYSACRDEDERTIYGFIRAKNGIKLHKEEVILLSWIISLIALLISAECLILFCIICAIFFALSCYIIRNVDDFERIYEKLID